MFAFRNRYLLRAIASTVSKHQVINADNVSHCTTIHQSVSKVEELHHSKLIRSSVRYKSKTTKKKLQDESDSEPDSDIEDEISDKSTKVMNVKVTSLRFDGLLKSSLGIARNKIDLLFYDSKIRLNGEKVLKKSAQVHEGDEIDVIKGVSPTNPKFLIVSRVEILKVTGAEEHINLKVRRCKTLTIENYAVPYKPGSSS